MTMEKMTKTNGCDGLHCHFALWLCRSPILPILSYAFGASVATTAIADELQRRIAAKLLARFRREAIE
jgi:hypothetical protein